MFFVKLIDMIEQEIFEHLFEIPSQSDDTGGVVTSCLVRDGKIVADGISTDDGIHSEYALLEKLDDIDFNIGPEDIVYTTVEPCGKRNSEKGKKYGDCTTNLIRAGIRKVVYVAADPDASQSTRYKFQEVGCALVQVQDGPIIKKAVSIFNSTVTGHHKPLPQQ